MNTVDLEKAQKQLAKVLLDLDSAVIHERLENSVFKILFDNLPIIAFISDGTGYGRFLNKKWTELTGMTIEDHTNGSWINCMYLEDVPQFKIKWEHSLATLEKFECQYRVYSPDGKFIHHLSVVGWPFNISQTRVAVTGYGLVEKTETR